jgi:hypothetical protein
VVRVCTSGCTGSSGVLLAVLDERSEIMVCFDARYVFAFLFEFSVILLDICSIKDINLDGCLPYVTT